MWLAEMAAYEDEGGYLPDVVREEIRRCDAVNNPNIIIAGVQFDMQLDEFSDAIKHLEQAMPLELECGPEAEAAFEMSAQLRPKFGL
jgi:hypothetical protein